MSTQPPAQADRSFNRSMLIKLFVVALMVRASVGLLKRSGRILLEAAPDGVDLEDIRAHILGSEHVRQVRRVEGPAEDA